MGEAVKSAGHASAPMNGAGGGTTLGSTLEPALIRACDGRLRDVRWFRSNWQRGGGSTGYAVFTDAAGRDHEAVIKVPVGYSEYRWTTALSPGPDEPVAPTPRVLACGTALNGYDLAWLVIERMPGHPLAATMDKRSIEDMLRATAQCQARAARLSPIGTPANPPTPPDWEKLHYQAREVVKHGVVADWQKWNNELKHVHRVLPTLVRKWTARPINAWCHGDLHPGNAMRRAPQGTTNGSATGPCVLIDLALMHAGHWLEDAVYFERVFWGHEESLHGVHVLSTLGAFRRELGLPCEGDYGALANVRRVLMAASAPALVEREGNPKYLHYALGLIQRLLPEAGH